jgi:hypothetical protein
MSHGIRAGDAITAATTAENDMPLVSSNAKHFKPVKEIKRNVGVNSTPGRCVGVPGNCDHLKVDQNQLINSHHPH